MLSAKTKEDFSILLLTLWLFRYSKKQSAGIIVLKVKMRSQRQREAYRGKSKESLNQKVITKTTGDLGSPSPYHTLNFNCLGGERQVW